MEKEDALAALEEVYQGLSGRFRDEHNGVHGPRLEQLRSALTTAQMAVEHLFDEYDREADLRYRVTTTPAGLPVDHPNNLYTKHGHQVR